MWPYLRGWLGCEESIPERLKRMEKKAQSYSTKKADGETLYKLKCVLNQREPYPFRSVFKQVPPAPTVPRIKDNGLRGGNHFISISIAEAVNRLPKDDVAAFPKQTYEIKTRSNWGYHGNHCFANADFKVNGNFGFHFSLEEIDVREAIKSDSPQALRSSGALLALQLYFLSYSNHRCIQSALQILLGCPIDKEYPKVTILTPRGEPLSKVLRAIGRQWGADRYEPILENEHVQYIIFEVVRGLQYLQKWALQHNAISLESVVVDANGQVKLHDFSEMTSFPVGHSAFNPQTKYLRYSDVYCVGLLAFAVYFGTSAIRCDGIYFYVHLVRGEDYLDALQRCVPLVYQRVIRHERRSAMIFDFIKFATGICGMFATGLTKCPLISCVDEDNYKTLQEGFYQLLAGTNVVKSTVWGKPEFYHPPSLNPVHQDGVRPNPPRIKYDSKVRKPFFEEDLKQEIYVKLTLTDSKATSFETAGFSILSERAILRMLMMMVDARDDHDRNRLFAADLIVLRAAIQCLLEEIYMARENPRTQDARHANRLFELVPNPLREKRRARLELTFVQPEDFNDDLDSFREDVKNGLPDDENIKIGNETPTNINLSQFLSNSQGSEDFRKYGYMRDAAEE